MPKIIYACVASWETKQLLAESEDSSNGSRVVVVEGIMPKLEKPESDGKMTCSKLTGKGTPVYVYNTSFELGISILQVCETDFSVSYSMQFQEDIAKAWGDSPSDSMKPGFKEALDREINRYNNDPPPTKFDAVHTKQNEIKEVLISNIEALVLRHEQIEITLDQTESLKATSKQFGQSAKKVKQTAQCQQYKTYAIAAAIVVCLIGVLVIIICVMAKC